MSPAPTPSRPLFASATVMAAILIGATAVACGSDNTTEPRPPTFVATMSAANERPNPVNAPGTGSATIVKNGTTYSYTISYSGLTGIPNNAHIHGPAGVNETATPLVGFPVAGAAAGTGTLTGTFNATQILKNVTPDGLDSLMRNGLTYVNVHTPTNGPGEIRGQLAPQ